MVIVQQSTQHLPFGRVFISSDLFIFYVISQKNNHYFKFRKRLLKNISKIKGNGNERCVSTHLKVCDFAAVNI